MPLDAKAIPNLIQGVSQQAPEQRRDTQCEAQYDCINSTVEGALARPGVDFLQLHRFEDFSNCFAYDIFRTEDEQYLAVVKDSTIRVFDLADGEECAVSFTAGDGHEAYLTSAALPKNSFTATTVDDFTFVANRETVIAVGATSSATRHPEAMFYVKAGGYGITYQVAIIYLGKIYTWTYTTPQSQAGNEKYISTNQIAATFYRAMTGAAATVTNSGDSTGGSRFYGVGPGGTGTTSDGHDPGGTVVGAITATSKGFTVELNGSVIRVYRTDDAAFDVDVGDGGGDGMLIAIKDVVQKFTDLPKVAISGFTVKIKGDSAAVEDDYYVTYRGTTTANGYWEECVATGTRLGLDASTMPYQLVNTGYRTFTFGRGTWSNRVAGDLTSALDPSFVGQKVQDIFYDHNRLAILVEGSNVWSKTNDPYTYYPDSVQTVLATAPVDIKVSGTKRISLLRRAIQVSSFTFLWAQKAQFWINTGQETKFTAETIQAPPVSAYEFAEQGHPVAVGSSFYFPTENGGYCTIRDVTFGVTGKPAGDTDVTGHVPKYIPAGIRYSAASDTLKLLAVTSDGAPSNLFVYNFLISDQQRLQSSWNTWRLPTNTTVLWAGIESANMHLLLQRPDGVMFAKVNLSPKQVDAEGAYLTRVDFKVRTSDCVISYDATSQTSSIALPYTFPEHTAQGFFVVVMDDTKVASGGYGRGKALTIDGWTADDLVRVKGDIRGYNLAIGVQIIAERQESDFYLRGRDGAEPVDKLTVSSITYTHANTGYYRAEVVTGPGRQFTYEFQARELNDPANVLNMAAATNGQLKVPVGQEAGKYTLTLINDSWLPSAWQTAQYNYTATRRASQAQGGGGGQNG